MSRLTTPKTERNREMICRYEDCDVCEEYCPHLLEDNCLCLQEVLEKLGNFEDKQEQGLLIVLPVAEGTEVWCIGSCGELCDNWMECEDCKEHEIVFSTNFDRNMVEQWGKTVFATEPEAEEALAKMGE